MTDTPPNPLYRRVEVQLPTGEVKSFVPNLSPGEMEKTAQWDGQDARGLWIDLLRQRLDVPIDTGGDWPDDFWLMCMRTVLKYNLGVDDAEASFEDGATTLSSMSREAMKVWTDTAQQFVKEHGEQLRGLASIVGKFRDDMLKTFAPVAKSYSDWARSVQQEANDEAPRFSVPYIGPSSMEVAQLKAMYSIEDQLQRNNAMLERNNEMLELSSKSSERWSWVIVAMTFAGIVVAIVSPVWWRIGILGSAVILVLFLRRFRMGKRKP